MAVPTRKSQLAAIPGSYPTPRLVTSKKLRAMMGTELTIDHLYVVTWIESRQAQQFKSKQPYASTTVSASRTAVVYFSRSGNTALAANH